MGADKEKDENKGEVTYEGSVEREGVKNALQNLAASIAEGKVVVEHGGEHVVLAPGSAVQLSLTAKKKGEKESIQIELSWQRESSADEQPTLHIGSQERATEAQAGAAEAASGPRPVFDRA